MVLEPEQTRSDSSFGRVKNLRNISDFAQFAKGCCTSGLELVNGLKNSGISTLRSSQELDLHVTTFKGYIKSSEGLIDRVRNTIDLVWKHLPSSRRLPNADVNRSDTH